MEDKDFSLVWEAIAISTFRLKVYGGWIVETVEFDEEHGACSSSVYIPDPSHLWIIEEKKEK